METSPTKMTQQEFDAAYPIKKIAPRPFLKELHPRRWAFLQNEVLPFMSFKIRNRGYHSTTYDIYLSKRFEPGVMDTNDWLMIADDGRAAFGGRVSLFPQGAVVTVYTD